MRITKKRCFSAILVFVLLAAAAGGAIFYFVGGAGQSRLEAWVGQQVKKTLNSYLVPQLEFDEVDYQYPKTVQLAGVRLVADDPDAPGTPVTIFEATSMRITLAEVPRIGKPIAIENVTLDTPTVRLITPAGGGPLVGYGQLVKAEPDADAPPLSEVLQLHLVSLADAQVVLDSREPDTTPTVFDQITTDLVINQDERGLYHVELDLDRAPALSARVQAAFDIDAFTVDIDAADIELRLDREQDRYLPQSVQALIKPYDATGDVELAVSGRLDLTTWQDSALKVDMTVHDVNAVIEDYRVVSERLRLVASMEGRVVNLTRLEADIYGGEVRGDGVMQLSEGYPFDLRLGGTGLVLEQTLAPVEGVTPRYAGVADFQLTANGPLTLVRTEVRGEGMIEVRQGRIARIAVISDIIDFMESAGDLSKPDEVVTGRDRADVAFRLRGDRAYLSKIELVGSWFAVRGRGNVFFDQTMNVQVNAGPLEKVQDTLGVVGDVFGALTDSMFAYRVSGTAAEPTIRPVAFGGLRGAPGDDEDDLPPWTPPTATAEGEPVDGTPGSTPGGDAPPTTPERGPDPRAVPDDDGLYDS